MHSGCKYYEPYSRQAGYCGIGLYEGKRISPGVCLMACRMWDGDPNLRRAYRQRVRLTVAGYDVRSGEPPLRVHRWLGLDWIGKPFLKRLRLRRSWPFVAVEEAPGCGCIMRLKNAWLRLRRRLPWAERGGGCGCQS